MTQPSTTLFDLAQYTAPIARPKPIALNPATKTLRDDQIKACEDMNTVFAAGFQDLLLRGSTGIGKTLTLSAYALNAALGRNTGQKQRVAIVMGLSTLPTQWRDALQELGLDRNNIGMIGDSQALNPDAPIVVIMVKTLANRQHLLDTINPDLVIADEAHELYFDRFLSGLRDDHWSRARWVWATATPWRLNKRQAFTRIDPRAIVQIFGTLRDVIAAGFLVPMRLLAVGGIDDVATLELTKNDTLKAADAAKLKTPEFFDRCADLIQEHGGDRHRAAGLCCDTDQAELAADHWNHRHPDKPATVIHSKLSDSEWDKRLEDWKDGRYWMAFSVGQFLTGFDWPPLDLLAWYRPTASRCLWIQGCGRALRRSYTTVKRDALILDFVGNAVLRVGHPLRTAEAAAQLKPLQREPGDAPEKQCPNCNELVSGFASLCPCCGHVFTQEQLELDGGEDAPFGEIPDPVLQDAINKSRGQLKAAYTRWKNGTGSSGRDKTINGLIEQFPAEYQAGHLYGWLRGSVFRGDRSAAAQCEMLRYLNTLAPINPGWVVHHFAIEFGFRVENSAKVSPFQLLGIPENSPRHWVDRRYQMLAKDQFDTDTSKLLRWAYDQAIAVSTDD